MSAGHRNRGTKLEDVLQTGGRGSFRAARRTRLGRSLALPWAFMNQTHNNWGINMWLAHTRVLFVFSCTLLVSTFAEAQSPYRMEGIVTDADSQQPVASVTVQVLITSELDPALRIRKSQTGEDGRYSIQLPPGHGWAWTLLPPGGYCPVETNATELFTTTVDNPVFTKNYQVRKGVPVRLMVRYPKGLTDKPQTFVSLGQQTKNEYIHGYCELDDHGTGTVTLLQLAGEYVIHGADQNRTLVASNGMTVRFEEGFDPRAVLPEVKKENDGITTIRDAQGRVATLRRCDALVRDNQLTIAIDLKSAGDKNALTKLSGRIVDAESNGIQDATVTLAFHSQGGSASSNVTAETDQRGYFSLGVPKLSAGQQITLSITRAGYGGMDTEPMPIEESSNQVLDAGTIKLDAGSSIRIRVVGPDGAPVHGAVVEPLNDYASRTRITRTGPDGECHLIDLAPGLMRISALFGQLSANTKVPLDPGENELIILKLAARTAVPVADIPKRPTPLAAGTAAPEWSIVEWTDGKQRKLADYRGKVVVLDFWGVWCGPCIHAIPAIKELQNLYKDQDVVFLGIHTAATDMTLVKRLLRQEEWNLTVGLDVGEEIVTGESVRRFAVNGFPTTIVVDRRGTIAFNSGDVPTDREVFMRDMEALARSAGLPWPIDKDATKEQVLERMKQLQVVMLSRRIDQALELHRE